MTTYTIRIEACDANGTIWQALAPAETVTDEASAQEIAEWTASNQTLAEGTGWRVRVWEGADVDEAAVEPAAEVYGPEPMVDTWQPGEVRRGTLLLSLADGTSYQAPAQVLILDVRPGPTPGAYRVLWTRYATFQGRELPHIAEARWQLTNAGTGDPRPGQGPIAVHLRDLVGHYEPGDPQANSLELLRDEAIATVQRRQAHGLPTDVAEAANAARQAEAHAEAAREHRDRLIRDALAAGTSAYEVARVTGLRVARIYQIRDGRR